MAADKILFSSDRPLSDPSQDRLGYASFAQQLAQAIHKLESPEGIVIAINGPWGSGKTTTLNFIVHYLEKIDQRERPVILRFTPWWFSGREDIVRLFFAELQRALSGSRFPERARKIAPKFFRLISPVLKAGVPYGEPISAGLEALINIAQQTDDIYELKQKLADALRKSKRRLIVVVDDVDRLTAEEIRQFFQAVKAVADLPNIIYLIAYDQQVVAQCLKDVQGVSGEEYLEKIVQVPLALPQFDKLTLRKLLFASLGHIFGDFPKELFDEVHWQKVYFTGVDYFIQTPRDVVRLVNSLAFNYALVRNEVNPADMVAIETLRLFAPEVYYVVRNNSWAFVGHWAVFDKNEYKLFHEQWIQQVSEERRSAIWQLLDALFPILPALRSGSSDTSASGQYATWRRQLRICVPENVPRYFRLAVPEGDISQAEMKALVSTLCDRNLLRTNILRLGREPRPDGSTRAHLFLELLSDYLDKDILEECTQSVVSVLLDIGDQLLLSETSAEEMFFEGYDAKIRRILYQSLRQLQPDARYELLEKVVSSGQAISTIVLEVMYLGAEHGKYGGYTVPDFQQMVTSEQLAELEGKAAQRIREAAESDKILELPKLMYVLYRWLDWDAESARKWAQSVVDNTDKLLIVLEKFMIASSNQIEMYGLYVKWLSLVTEPDPLVERVKQLAAREDLTEMQKSSVNQFIEWYELSQQERHKEIVIDELQEAKA